MEWMNGYCTLWGVIMDPCDNCKNNGSFPWQNAGIHVTLHTIQKTESFFHNSSNPQPFVIMVCPTTGSYFYFLKCYKDFLGTRVHTSLKSFMSWPPHKLRKLLRLSPHLVSWNWSWSRYLCKDSDTNNHKAIIISNSSFNEHILCDSSYSGHFYTE